MPSWTQPQCAISPPFSLFLYSIHLTSHIVSCRISHPPVKQSNITHNPRHWRPPISFLAPWSNPQYTTPPPQHNPRLPLKTHPTAHPPTQDREIHQRRYRRQAGSLGSFPNRDQARSRSRSVCANLALREWSEWSAFFAMVSICAVRMVEKERRRNDSSRS